MNPEVKQMWVDALRSGEYLQYFGALERNGKFCFLGVLQDLAPAEIKRGPDRRVLSVHIRDWAGLDNTDPIIGGKYASYWNDIEGLSFDQLADLVEEYL